MRKATAAVGTSLLLLSKFVRTAGRSHAAQGPARVMPCACCSAHVTVSFQPCRVVCQVARTLALCVALCIIVGCVHTVAANKNAEIGNGERTRTRQKSLC